MAGITLVEIAFLERRRDRWLGRRAWDDWHHLALVAGALSFFILLSLLLESAGVAGMSLVGLVAAIRLWQLGRRVNRRAAPGPELQPGAV
jgi:uncharacterized iron-regulated membrane protein